MGPRDQKLTPRSRTQHPTRCQYRHCMGSRGRKSCCCPIFVRSIPCGLSPIIERAPYDRQLVSETFPSQDVTQIIKVSCYLACKTLLLPIQLSFTFTCTLGLTFNPLSPSIGYSITSLCQYFKNNYSAMYTYVKLTMACTVPEVLVVS